MSDFEDEIKAELDALSDSSLQDDDDDLPINIHEDEEIKEKTRSEGIEINHSVLLFCFEDNFVSFRFSCGSDCGVWHRYT